jgi:hypothetical protein
MTNLRTKARLAVSEFQSASRTKFEAERDFTRAHDQLGKLLDDLILENEELRKLAELEAVVVRCMPGAAETLRGQVGETGTWQGQDRVLGSVPGC